MIQGERRKHRIDKQRHQYYRRTARDAAQYQGLLAGQPTYLERGFLRLVLRLGHAAVNVSSEEKYHSNRLA